MMKIWLSLCLVLPGSSLLQAEDWLLVSEAHLGRDVIMLPDVMADSRVLEPHPELKTLCLGLAPAPGQSIELNRHDIARKLMARGVVEPKLISSHPTVKVKRAALHDRWPEVERVLRQSIKNDMPEAEKIELKFLEKPPVIDLAPHFDLKIKHSELPKDHSGEGKVLFDVKTLEGRTEVNLQVGMTVWRHGVFPKRPVAFGTILEKNQLRTKLMEITSPDDDRYHAIAQVVGLKSKRGLQTSRGISPEDLTEPILVRRGQKVEVVNPSNPDLPEGFKSVTYAMALHDGARDEVIEFEHFTSKRRFRAKVSGHNQATSINNGARGFLAEDPK